MGLYLRRLLVYLCLGLAVALAVPHRDSIREFKTGPRVFASATALTRPDIRRVCPGQLTTLTEVELKAWPEVARAAAKLIDLKSVKGRLVLTTDQGRRLITHLAGKNKGRVCFRSGDGYYRLEMILLARKSLLYLVGLAPKAARDLPRLGAADVTDYPGLAAYVQGLHQPGLGLRGDSSRWWFYRTEETDIDPAQWSAALARLKLDPNHAVFQSGGFIITGWLEETTYRQVTELAWLTWLRYGLALVGLIAGLWLARGIYPRLPGLAINPRWTGVTADIMFGLASAAMAYAVVEYALIDGLGTQPGWVDEAVRVVGSWMYLPATAFMSFFAANMTGQSIEITDEGIIKYGPGGREEAAWDEITGLTAKDSYVMVGRMGLPMPRKLQTKLVVKLEGDELVFYEPGLRSIKAEILDRLRNRVPERLQADLDEVEARW